MRSSISAQSWLSVPPAPGCTVTMAFSAIGLAGEHGARFQLFGKCGQGFDVALQIGEHVFAFAGKLEVGIDVAGAANQFLIVGDQRFESLAVAHQRLAGCGIGPHGRIGQFRFNSGEFPAQAGRVKDTPAGRGLGRARERRRIRDRLMPCFALRT